MIYYFLDLCPPLACTVPWVQEPQITQQNISPPALFLLPSIAMHSVLTPCRPSTDWAIGHSRLIIYPYPEPPDTPHGKLLCYLNAVSGLGVSVARDDPCKHHPFLVSLLIPPTLRLNRVRPSPSGKTSRDNQR